LQYVTKDDWVFFEIRKGMYSFPQAGVLAHRKLCKILAPHGYASVPYTPGLWRHQSQPIVVALVVDDFGVKYQNRADAKHLQDILLANCPFAMPVVKQEDSSSSYPITLQKLSI